MDCYDWAGWSEWTLLATLDLSHVPYDPGAYVVRTNRPITRAVGKDALGLLDIGESGGLRTRLSSFVRCATKYGEGGHMAGWRYAFLRLGRHFAYDTLSVRWKPTDSKVAAKNLEGRVMLAYLFEHCELPPLNYSFNWGPFEQEGWDLFDKMIETQSP